MSSERGMALVMVLIFTLLIFTAGAALLDMAFKENLVARYHAAEIRQHYLAEAGLEAALHLLNCGGTPQDLHYASEEGAFDVHFNANEPGAAFSVASSGSTSSGSTTLKVRVNKTREGVYYIEEWVKQ